MVQHPVAVEDVDLLHRRLGHQVEDIGSGPAHPHDRQTPQRQLARDGGDPGAARGGVDVVEGRLALRVLHGGEGLGRHPGLERHRGMGDDVDVSRNLFEVVLVAVARLVGEGMVGHEAVAEILIPALVLDLRDQGSIPLAGMFPYE